MAHSKELRWNGISQLVGDSCSSLLEVIIRAENIYQDLLVSYQDAGGTDQAFANQLFKDELPITSPATEANADQVQMVTDLRQSMVSAHEVYEALTNVAVTQKDRATDLRRMS